MLLEGHTAAVYDVCPMEGGRVASASKDCTVRVWSLGTGECLRALKGHTGEVTSVCMLQNGCLASLSHYAAMTQWGQHYCKCDETLRLWRVDGSCGTGEEEVEVAAQGSERFGQLREAAPPRLFRNTHHPLLEQAGVSPFVLDVAAAASVQAAGVVVVGDFGGNVHFLELVHL